MSRVKIKAYLSPTLVLLALDWSDGESRKDFLGFAVSRTPGFYGQKTSWLPNRIGFDGPAPRGKDFPSDQSPIQKFLWWDARIDDRDRGTSFVYRASPVVGTKEKHRVLEEAAKSISVKVPMPVQGKIGSYFNRAVVSSQAFSRKFGGKLSGERLGRALAWLGNGMEEAVPRFLKQSPRVEGAIYHLTDDEWIIPAMKGSRKDTVSLVYNDTRKDHGNKHAVEALGDRVRFSPRTKAAIMHNKFLVRLEGGRATGVLMGSANFTTGGLTTQANLLHTWDSPALADLYLKRKQLLEGDPAVSATAAEAGWSNAIRVDGAKIRVFFPPEPKGERASIQAVVDSVKGAKTSVLFCLFSPTDRELREAIFAAGDKGLMMFGLVNSIGKKAPDGEATDASTETRIELYHRSRRKKDVFSHSLYPRKGEPGGFWWEVAKLPGDQSQWPVYIHHKFVVVDGESDHSIIYTGSANMSGNALYRNDENLMEIKDSPSLSAIYLAEFLRLYEHYRARATWNTDDDEKRGTYKLRKNSSWARKAYTAGSPEFKSRTNMV